ncbi:MAG: ATP-binding protein [Spirochaetaceae bacterium]|jgi:anti-sigma regulatory factor (Ser/Thr protein kinase)|nr:ATP-binding protein [Spirochaetaceae bacterium]
MADEIKFKVRARLLEQMGEQLIKSESIALMELIKNSYDADASHCVVEMHDMDNPEKGSIIITDDGTGMNYDIFKNVWLEIGTSNKADKKETEEIDKKGIINEKKIERSKKFNRIPLGEKGIGRFGVHRLGHEIEIISRMEGSKECRLFVNWDAINKSKYIEDFPISLEERPPEIFKKGYGTKIIIQRLKSKWNKATVRECARTITSLNSPFDNISNFRTELIIDKSEWLMGLLKFDEIETYKLYSFEAKMEGSRITKFGYTFIPYPDMKGIEKTVLGIEAIIKNNSMVRLDEDKKPVDVDLSTEKIGPVIFKGIIFDFDTNILKLSRLSDRKGLKEYLRDNGGIRIFRDNVRIWDYGEPENDWLEMESRRINRPGTKISKRQILGAVYLDSEKSRALIETADREGFVDNNAYQLLKYACRAVLEKIEIFRRADKERLRILYGNENKEIPVVTSLDEAKRLIDENIPDKKIVKEIDRCLDRIQVDYDRITNSLIKSAGAGLNLIGVVHQMQKIIKNIISGIENNVSIQEIRSQIDDLARLVEGYSILIKNSEKKVRNIKGIIEKALFNLEFRIKVHNIELNSAFRNRLDHIDCICTESHVVSAIMNLVDNSIWWIDFSKKKEKSIYIDISSELKGYTTIIVADTGTGFTIPVNLLGKPFVTDKPDGAGMGIGLNLTTLIMESLGGKILYPDYDDFFVPQKYKDGAIVALAFKEKE